MQLPLEVQDGSYKMLPVQYIAGVRRPDKRSASGNVLTRKAIKEGDEEGAER